MLKLEALYNFRFVSDPELDSFVHFCMSVKWVVVTKTVTYRNFDSIVLTGSKVTKVFCDR